MIYVKYAVRRKGFCHTKGRYTLIIIQKLTKYTLILKKLILTGVKYDKHNTGKYRSPCCENKGAYVTHFRLSELFFCQYFRYFLGGGGRSDAWEGNKGVRPLISAALHEASDGEKSCALWETQPACWPCFSCVWERSTPQCSGRECRLRHLPVVPGYQNRSRSTDLDNPDFLFCFNITCRTKACYRTVQNWT